MKASFYNYIVPNGNNTIFFNGITEKFFEVPSEKSDVYKEIIHNPSVYRQTFGAFVKRMVENGFIVGDNVDEEINLEKNLKQSLSKICIIL